MKPFKFEVSRFYRPVSLSIYAVVPTQTARQLAMTPAGAAGEGAAAAAVAAAPSKFVATDSGDRSV